MIGGCGTPPADRAAHAGFVSNLGHQTRGRPFRMRELVPGRWTKMWVFGGYTPSEEITRVVGKPWRGAPAEVPEAESVLVLRGPGSEVRGFTFDGPKGVYTGCMPAGPIKPNDRYALIGPVPGEGLESNFLGPADATC